MATVVTTTARTGTEPPSSRGATRAEPFGPLAQDGRPSSDGWPSHTVAAMEASVLVADDEPHIVDVVRAYLERDGYRVTTALDGAATLEAARASKPDLLILDVMMPRASGFDVLRALRAEGATCPVIFLTARDHVIDRVAGLELGADDYVTKPFEPRELVARVGAVLRRVRGTEPASAPGPVGKWAAGADQGGVSRQRRRRTCRGRGSAGERLRRPARRRGSASRAGRTPCELGALDQAASALVARAASACTRRRQKRQPIWILERAHGDIR